MPGISLIICCYNSARTIQETLKHIFGQELSPDQAWEVLLVNNNSSDNTVDLAREMASQNEHIDFKIVDEPRAGLSYARETGVRSTKYPVISFVDDDNLIPKNWVAYMSEKFSDENVGVLGCTAIGRFDVEPPEWYTKDHHKFAFATGRLYAGAPFLDITQDALLFGAGLTLRKEIFEKLWQRHWEPLLMGRKGQVQTGGDDSEITLAARLLGYRLFFTDEVKLTHWITGNRLSLERLKKMTAGFGMADVFLLAYNYCYFEKEGQLSPVFRLRRYWWFNYFGKSLAFLKAKLKSYLGRDKFDQEINSIRAKAFCQCLLAERKKFNQSFDQVRKLVNA
ncbi:glycosyltransferase [Marinilongibacter aquaticus]|uniref:glycosyltransferase n=1 Tax=Marinilongibacter aquaticus TaxID=2975157 RepID=UPI0021BD58D0|nr:glycosyltransferase [Marinilongibacter aquaticus]UBM57907.1 glycosyltransferase [Marinilongibacter aquaticus]